MSNTLKKWKEKKQNASDKPHDNVHKKKDETLKQLQQNLKVFKFVIDYTNFC